MQIIKAATLILDISEYRPMDKHCRRVCRNGNKQNVPSVSLLVVHKTPNFLFSTGTVLELV